MHSATHSALSRDVGVAMLLLVLAFATVAVLPITVGAFAHRRHWSVRGGPTSWGTAAAQRVGRAPAGVLIVAVGYAVTFGASLVLGVIAKALEDRVDRPAFDWIHPRVHNNSFTRLNEKLTYMGNNPIVQVVAVVAVIVLACAFKRRWWLPVAAIGFAYLAEHYVQKWLADVVDRGHPPTTLGTFPSGGVGRILAVYGAVVALVLILDPLLSRAWRAGLWTGLLTAAVIEAYTRLYLSRHWLTDALFGLPFGGMLLLTNVAALGAFAQLATDPARVSRSTDRAVAAGNR